MLFKAQYTIALFGNRDFSGNQKLTEPLNQIIYHYANRCNYLELLVGRNGAFDLFASSVIHAIKKEAPERIFLTLVLPYMTKEVRDNEASFYEFYDDIIILPMTERVHFKAAITRRNECMIDRADVVITYTERTSGGAYHAREYAKKQGKTCIELEVFL